ncbi:Rpn family recombination-promoting nuclease/putative transposase [Nostoc sp. UHCC 0252]|uniref:Rpn family recombination-promoting nuclease/putative transposase n=1 Tax=Nostoc sp. UHCC 0252 TaxID=3110241 RepID=UPI002B21F80E|nr:Rpn family recombination-promoting nuclease/putative transposase [Nostoc sp. UHCC 0252]MEA5600104.1 Rpn family recombination-promoting nuclease/putative transposase [Nostoc sp. UHCC 0252]
MSFDNLCKLLSEKHPATFASWVLGTPQTNVKVLKTELSIEPIRADYVTFLQLEGRILHLEFQTKLESTPPLPLRMLDYWVRLYRLYRLPITQVVVLLLPPAPETVIETVFSVETTRHEYRVISIWEEKPELFLNEPALLPLAPLAATTQPQTLLKQVVERVNQLQPGQRPEISAYTQILAGLKYKKDLIRQLFREGMMRESVIYQEILAEGEQIGVQRGEQIGEQRGEQRERSLILRQLTRRIGELPQEVLERIETLSLEQLENLGEALLDFQAIADLNVWFSTLAQH